LSLVIRYVWDMATKAARAYKNDTQCHAVDASSHEDRSTYPNKPMLSETFLSLIVWEYLHSFLRATAVPAGTAERVLAMAIPSVRPSVRLSVCRSGV